MRVQGTASYPCWTYGKCWSLQSMQPTKACRQQRDAKMLILPRDYHIPKHFAFHFYLEVFSGAHIFTPKKLFEIMPSKVITSVTNLKKWKNFRIF
jgi:hypothetical protein